MAELKKLVVEYSKKAEAEMQEHEFSVELDDRTRYSRVRPWNPYIYYPQYK